MPGNEFLLGKAKEAFDENGNLIAEGTRQFLESTLQKFVEFIDVISKLEGLSQKTYLKIYMQKEPLKQRSKGLIWQQMIG